MLSRVLRRFSQFRNEFRMDRKPRTKAIEKYPVLPDWLKKTEKDPFDYKLRSKEEVRKYIKENPPCFNVNFEIKKYPNEDRVYQYMSRIVRMTMEYKDLNFTPKQLERFKFLLGARCGRGSDSFTIRVDSFMEPKDNAIRAAEILNELYLEAVRAP